MYCQAVIVINWTSKESNATCLDTPAQYRTILLPPMALGQRLKWLRKKLLKYSGLALSHHIMPVAIEILRAFDPTSLAFLRTYINRLVLLLSFWQHELGTISHFCGIQYALLSQTSTQLLLYMSSMIIWHLSSHVWILSYIGAMGHGHTFTLFSSV